MPTVLLVDDDDAILDVLTEYLGLHFTMLTAASGDLALPILRSGADIDVLVSDVLMPGITGIELAKAARALRPDLPVVLMSGSWALTQMPEGYDFLPKPFRFEALLAAIHAALREPA